MVIRKYEELFKKFQTVEMPVDLFDKIMLVIKKEKKLRQERKKLLVFSFLLAISLIVTSVFGKMLILELKNSGVAYFILTAFSDLGIFWAFWKDFVLIILESLPFTKILLFMLSFWVFLFILRLFFYRKKLLKINLIQNFYLKYE